MCIKFMYCQNEGFITCLHVSIMPRLNYICLLCAPCYDLKGSTSFQRQLKYRKSLFSSFCWTLFFNLLSKVVMHGLSLCSTVVFFLLHSLQRLSELRGLFFFFFFPFFFPPLTQHLQKCKSSYTFQNVTTPRK